MRTVLPAPEPLGLRIREFSFLDLDLCEEWFFNRNGFSTLLRFPQVPPVLNIPSACHTDAPEIELQPNVKAQTFTYQHVEARCTAGAQVLLTSGWRPDCAGGNKVNVTGTLLPVTKQGAPIFIGSPDLMRHMLPVDVEAAKGVLRGVKPEFCVEMSVGAFFQQGYGLSSASFRAPGASPATQE